MEIYNKLKSVPTDALKRIEGGRLKGMSDISPQWRIERLTEVFGVVGFGWKVESIIFEFKEKGDEIVCFCSLSLRVRMNDTWSEPILGEGGSKFSTVEKHGVYVCDESKKMAYTDALGNASKLLGLAGDVYRGHGSKYSTPTLQATQPQIEVTWLSAEQFNMAMKSDAKGVEATLKAYSTETKKMKKEYKEQLELQLLTLKK